MSNDNWNQLKKRRWWGCQFDLFSQFGKFTINNIRKSKGKYLLGCIAIFLVVIIVSSATSIISKVPIVFLRLSELDNGETDILLTPQDYVVGSALNYSSFANLFPDPPYNAHTPRRKDRVEMVFSKECPDRLSSSLMGDIAWMYFPQSEPFCGNYCFKIHCSYHIQFINLFMIDSKKETEIYLGREWTLPPLNLGEIYLLDSLMQSGHSRIGDYVYIEIRPFNLFGEAWNDFNKLFNFTHLNFYLPYKIAGSYPSPKGKHKSGLLNVGIIEYDQLMPYLLEHLKNYSSLVHPQSASREIHDLIDSYSHLLDLRAYANMIVINFPPPRLSAYMESNYDLLQKNVMLFSSPFFEKVGFSMTKCLTFPIWTHCYCLG